MDKYHAKGTMQRKPYLENLFHSRGLIPVDPESDIQTESNCDQKVFAFWGATEDEWIGSLWPRGRALKMGLSKAGPSDEFCCLWSGSKNFLDYHQSGSEVNIQLADVYPFCPMIYRPIGNLPEEPLIEQLERCQQHPVYQALNQGHLETMGETLGLSDKYGFNRSRELGNHCLWCDEFFTKYAPHLLQQDAITERGTVDLVHLQLEN